MSGEHGYEETCDVIERLTRERDEALTRADELCALANQYYDAIGCSLCADRLKCERHPRVMEAP